MDYETILFGVDDGVAVLTLNRPEVMNAWNERMSAELADALRACEEDDAVRAVVLTGAGRAFCAGQDLSGGAETFDNTNTAGPDQPQGWPAVTPWQINKPVLAALNGHAIGVGITYPMMCDIRFVAEDAKIQFAFVRRGIVPELASHVIVARVAGLSNAADLLLTGRMVNGREFAALGLASGALPSDEVLPATLERAREFRQAAPASVAISKRLLWDGMVQSIPEMAKREMRLLQWAGSQVDAQEGVMAFLEKREPKWRLSAKRDLPDLGD
jgi:enoyl-CoA hydratase/carnithine racemase